MSPLLLWIGVVIAASSLSVPQESPPNVQPEVTTIEPSEVASQVIDARVRRSAVRSIRAGVTLFNEQRDAAGCYRLFQGALIGIEPMLAHHPELQSEIGTGLDHAAGLASTDISRAAFELRGLLDQTYEATKGDSPSREPLWNRLGGEETVRAIVHDFVALAAGDEEVNFFRDSNYLMEDEEVARFEQRLVEFISSVTGGPLQYSGRPMGPLHEGMAIDDDEFNALAADLVAVLRKYEVPQAEIDELLAIVSTTRDEIVEEP